MKPTDEEAQSFTTEDFSSERSRGSGLGYVKTIGVSVVTTIVTCCCIGAFAHYSIRRSLYPEPPPLKTKNCSTNPAEDDILLSVPRTEKSTWTKPNDGMMFARFTIQQEQLFDKKNNSSIFPQDAMDCSSHRHTTKRIPYRSPASWRAPMIGLERFAWKTSRKQKTLLEHNKVNWTQTIPPNSNRTVTSKMLELFQIDSDGCILIPKSGHWLVHSEVTFATSNTTDDKVWVYLQVNNASMFAKKTLTLPRKQYRPNHAHLPIDITDVIYLNEHDVLCVLVSEWRTVYASDKDNSLTLVYLPVSL